MGKRNRDGTASPLGASLVLLLTTTVLSIAPPAQAKIYWISLYGRREVISRADLSGGGLTGHFITSGLNKPCGIAVAGGHIYWANEGIPAGEGGYPGNGHATIGRASLSGKRAQGHFIRGASSPCSLVAAAGYLYWINTTQEPGPSSFGYSYTSTIGRASLDGRSVNQNYLPLPGCSGACGSLAIRDGYVYWTGIEGIGRETLTGRNVNLRLVRNRGSLVGVTTSSSYLFWSFARGGFFIGRAGLNGTGVANHFLTHTDGPRNALSNEGNLATQGRYLYWDWYWLDDFNRPHAGIARVWQNGSHRQMAFVRDAHVAGFGGLAVAPG